MNPEILRYAAFAAAPGGGNPAGVVLDAAGLDDERMLAIAAEVGYSETAFLIGDRVRFFSPLAEVPFCGHATVATAVALAERDGVGRREFLTRNGEVPVTTRIADDRSILATLTSVPPRVAAVDDAHVEDALAALHWSRDDLDPLLPPRVAYAGAQHLVLAAATRSRLAELDYDLPRLGALMADRDWTTVALVHRIATHVFVARNPFPPGGVIEDPATGASAAAVGAYLRDLGLISPPAEIEIRQGEDMGRPSRLLVGIPEGAGGIDVTGSAVAI